MADIIYTNSLYTSAICELERTADFVDELYKEQERYFKDSKELIAAISDAIRRRADRLRELEARYA